MTGSTLSFISTSSFINSLMAKNLSQYTVPGVYTPPSGPLNYEISQTVSNVIDSPDTLISDDPYAQQLYPLNEYGPNGGYNLNITYNNPPLPVNSNQGEYSPTDTVLDLVNEIFKYWQGQYEIISNPNDLHESELLSLSILKSKKYLNWEPNWSFEESIYYTIDWYKNNLNGMNALENTLKQIQIFNKND